MRSVLSVVLSLVVSLSALFLTQGGVAVAAFHCVRIHAVAGALNNDTNVQYVELRMDIAGQTFFGGHTLQFFNTAGQLKATFTFPNGPANGAMGDSILVATSEFNSSVTGGSADFTFSGANTTGANGGDPLHPIQLPGGSVVWGGPSAQPACSTLMAPVDSVAYGSAVATYGSAAVALPNPGIKQALRLSNLNNAPSNNSTEYALQNVAASTFSVLPGNLATDFTTPRNNARTVLKLNALSTTSSVGGVAEVPRGTDAPAGIAASSGGTSWHTYRFAGGAAAVLFVVGTALYVYRRRMV